MAVNKVVINDEVVLDLTGDTVQAADLPKGVIAHSATGAKVTGTTNYAGSSNAGGAATSANKVNTYDRPDALFYCDPPYIGTESYYRAPFTTDDHVRLANVLHNIKGRFLLSYNDCPLVHDLYGDCQIEPLTRLNQLPAAGPTEYKELLVCNYL